jgi:hypothetical protein
LSLVEWCPSPISKCKDNENLHKAKGFTKKYRFVLNILEFKRRDAKMQSFIFDHGTHERNGIASCDAEGFQENFPR